ncbi:MAG: hypothetical protein IKG97_03045 [Lachnospiraceae bacterium]|nr:hypothetical protein [Lachnospiraceae bacterium]
MVSKERLYQMTKAAVFEQKEQKRALRIVNYRRRDYILSRMLLVLLSVSIAYAVLVAAILFMVIMAYESLILNVGQMILIVAGILIGYGLVLAFYYVVSHKYFGEKHVKACRDVKEYLRTLKAIEKIDREQEKAQKTVRTTITAESR